MRTIVLALVVLVLTPSVLAFAAEWSDPPLDERTYVGSVLVTKTCRHAGIDITSARVEREGAVLSVAIAVVDVQGHARCGNESIGPAEQGSLSVSFQNCGGACNPSLVAYRTWTRDAAGVTASEMCYSVDGAPAWSCARNRTFADSVIRWSIPLKTSVHDIRGACYSAVVAEASAAPVSAAAAPALRIGDRFDAGGYCV